MEDADERTRLLPQTNALPALVGGKVALPDPRSDESLKRYMQEVREISREVGSAKVVEWISLPCAIASTLAPLLVATMEPSLLQRKFFRMLFALTGIETFAGFGIPPIIVLWSLYANENEAVISPAVIATERRAVRGVIGCQIIVTICLVVAAVANLHLRQDTAGGAVDFPLVQKAALLFAACELASAFVFVVLGVYKWLIAQTMTCISLRADAITCFAAVYLSIIAGVAHLCDVLSFTRAGPFAPASKEVRNKQQQQHGAEEATTQLKEKECVKKCEFFRFSASRSLRPH